MEHSPWKLVIHAGACIQYTYRVNTVCQPGNGKSVNHPFATQYSVAVAEAPITGGNVGPLFWRKGEGSVKGLKMAPFLLNGVVEREREVTLLLYVII